MVGQALSRIGPETSAIISELRKLEDILKATYQSLNGRFDNPIVRGEAGMRVEQNTKSKGATFTDTEFNCDGFNLVQVSSDGTLSDITYKVRNLNGTVGDSLTANLSPQVVGYHQALLVSNAAVQAGKTVFITKYLVPWAAIGGIWHGTNEAGGGVATDARFTPIFKGALFNTSINTATDFFGTNLVPTNTPTLFRVWCSLATSFKIIAQITQGGTTKTSAFNNNVALTAASGFGPADILLETTSGATVFNLRHDSGGAVNVDYCVVEEIPAGTQ